jgi:hypothetical protein
MNEIKNSIALSYNKLVLIFGARKAIKPEEWSKERWSTYKKQTIFFFSLLTELEKLAEKRQEEFDKL